MMKNISNLELMLKAARLDPKPVFSDLYEQNKSSSTAPKVPTTEQIKDLYAKAYKEGYARGEREAKAAVHALMEQETALLKQALHQLAQGFNDSLVRHSEQTSSDMLNLALDIAKIMVRAHIQIKPDAVIPVIKHSIELLPTQQKPLRLTVHPDDVALVTSEIAVCFEALEFTVVGDPRIDRGGCWLDSDSNVVDASNARRWKLLSQALGCSNDWFEERR